MLDLEAVSSHIKPEFDAFDPEKPKKVPVRTDTSRWLPQLIGAARL
jgi:hypothetical protein